MQLKICTNQWEWWRTAARWERGKGMEAGLEAKKALPSTNIKGVTCLKEAHEDEAV